MQKIPTLYLRDKANPKLVTDQVDPDCEWVLCGASEPHEKFDGSACLIHDGRLYRRHRVKEGKAPPSVWLHWTFDTTQLTGHGWALVGDGTADQYHREAAFGIGFVEGTYELVGPTVQKNPYKRVRHELWRHGRDLVWERLPDLIPLDHGGLGQWLADYRPIEGVVWYHPDGRMAKIKRRDFGLAWPA